MANDTTPPKAPEKPDPEVVRLEKETARELARQKLRDARLGALEALSPGVTDLPKNEVTVGAGAGALGPWLAQDVLATVAQSIADAAGTVDPKPAVVFVTADPHLLGSDVTSRQVRDALIGRTNELTALVTRLENAGTALTRAVNKLRKEELQDQPGLLADEGDAAKTATDEAPAAAATGPFAVAIDLVRLLATDYTLTAAEVTVDSALLARLTASLLAEKDGVQVLLDGFAPAGSSATLTSYKALHGEVSSVVDRVLALSARVAPVVAEADAFAAAAEDLREKWTATRADDEAAAGAAADFKTELDLSESKLRARRSAAAPALALVEHAEGVVAAVRAEVAALAEPDASGVTPLQRACSRECLHEPVGTRATHVLLVSATHAGADVITRRSVLGTSGRVAYLGGANGSWVLANVATGALVGGGAKAAARQLTHDIASGGVHTLAVDATPSEPRRNDFGVIEPPRWSSTDPLARSESMIRIGVLLLALGITLIGVAATLSVFF